jgi:uncharacterized membrane protein YciS (DUF1049 family)
MNDLVSAAGILVGVVGFLYGAWYSDIAKALAIPVETLRPEDSKDERDEIQATIRSRVRPLAIAVILLAMALIPDSIRIVASSINNVATNGVVAATQYDVSQACYLLLEVFAVYMAIAIARTWVKLHSAKRTLTPKRPTADGR